ncbi:MAG: GWxTD domain-containing protein [Gemmatimonadota bacterium]|nr:GWxTD domain-containing protein [Gemmatimonadota bacterium]MDE2829629.1 GWxTD domain-containing protein [Gemmatimonadota bacterium]
MTISLTIRAIREPILIALLLLTGVPAWADRLQESFGARADSLAAVLIAERAGPDSADVYRVLNREKKTQFLIDFWQRHNPVVLQFYYGYHIGRRYLTVSDAFFERGRLIPQRYKTRATPPDPALLNDAVALFERLLRDDADDRIALCALGYCLLEQHKGVEAERIFVRVLEKDRRFLIARHGRALACLIQKKQVRRALDLFQDTVSLDSQYEAAYYNLAMCHLAMRSVDMDHHFSNVVKRFPQHRDAYFKLGIFYESLYYFEKAVKALSKQVAVNPAHSVARGRLARVAMELKYLKQELHTTTELRDLAQKDPERYLPLLGAQYLESGAYEQAEASFSQFLSILPDNERDLYEDVTLLLSAKEFETFRMIRGEEKRAFTNLFWRKIDPTPTTLVNERRLEHYRRVNYAIQNFSEGRIPYDARGDVYIRFGHPDHRSWSDHLVFETNAKVIRVKNRLMDLAGQALHEIAPTTSLQAESSYGSNTVLRVTPEVRGLPIFPMPHQGALFRDGASLNYKWETWIYAHIGEGIEVTFLDALGNFDFQFPQPPIDSPNRLLWQHLAPEAVVARVVNRTPSVYHYPYPGDPMPLLMSVADFRGNGRDTRLDAFIGIPWTALKTQKRGTRVAASVNRMWVLFDAQGTEIARDSLNTRATQPETVDDPGVLWVDQVTTEVKPGHYLMAVRVSDPASGKLQIHRQLVDVEAYNAPTLMVSDLVVAGKIATIEARTKGKFIRDELEVLPLPSHTFAPEQPVYLYYKVYNLFRDDTGQTHYRVDYAVRGSKNASARLLKGIGTLLGISEKQEGVQVSYEHRGNTETEPVYVALNVAAKPGQKLTIGVTVTDLIRPGKPTATKDVWVAIGK